MFLLHLALTIAAIHLSVPLAYYAYLGRYVNKPWDLQTDDRYTPALTIIVPTYNEAVLVQDRLDNVVQQSYPRGKIEIIVVDSASDDGTVQFVTRWASENRRVRLKVLEESFRRGKSIALNLALEHVSSDSDLVVFTDVDCAWRTDALRNAVRYISDPIVGGVTCSIFAPTQGTSSFEATYRDLSNYVRISESKLWSTPIAHGPFVLFRREVLSKIGGIPSWTGADDSGPASLMGFIGYRCIQAPDVVAYEYVPESMAENVTRRIRRAQHLIQNFTRTRKRAMTMSTHVPRKFDRVFILEAFMHAVNPWLLVLAVMLFALDCTATFTAGPHLVTLTLALLTLLFFPSSRAWILTQVILAYASIKNLFKEERIWKPVRRTRVSYT